MNITNITYNGLTNNNVIPINECKEWCSAQHFTANYSQFLILLLFNAVMTAVFLVLYRCSDNLVHNTKLTEAKLGMILHSIVKLVFLVNVGFGIWFMYTN